MPAAVRGIARAVATAAVVVAVDQVAKQLVVANIRQGELVAVIPGLDLTNTRNSGVAFGALAGGGWVLAALISVALLALLSYFALHAAQPWLWLPVGLLVGGALGNLADRGREGAVIDYIDPIAWPAFNVADACIVIGVFVLLYVVDRQTRSADARPAQSTENDGPATS